VAQSFCDVFYFYFFRDGVEEETLTNASCFVVLFPVNMSSYNFFK
jgi:hypothetical protein